MFEKRPTERAPFQLQPDSSLHEVKMIIGRAGHWQSKFVLNAMERLVNHQSVAVELVVAQKLPEDHAPTNASPTDRRVRPVHIIGQSPYEEIASLNQASLCIALISYDHSHSRLKEDHRPAQRVPPEFALVLFADGSRLLKIFLSKGKVYPLLRLSRRPCRRDRHIEQERQENEEV